MGNANSSLESTRDDSESMKLERTGTNVAVAGELVGLLKIDNTNEAKKSSQMNFILFATDLNSRQQTMQSVIHHAQGQSQSNEYQQCFN
jgi:hypothetical protein